jgi:hypothetical protein
MVKRGAAVSCFEEVWSVKGAGVEIVVAGHTIKTCQVVFDRQEAEHVGQVIAGIGEQGKEAGVDAETGFSENKENVEADAEGTGMVEVGDNVFIAHGNTDGSGGEMTAPS